MESTGHKCPTAAGRLSCESTHSSWADRDYVTGISVIIFAAIVNLFSACLIPFGGGRRKFVSEGVGCGFGEERCHYRSLIGSVL